MLLHDASSPIATPRVLLGSKNVVLEDVYMNTAQRHERQMVHEAQNLAPPPVHPRLFSQLPENEVVVFNGPGTPSLWHVCSQTLPQSSSFKYLGLVFHEPGSLSPALKQLAQNAVGARAQLQTKFKRLMCDRSVPMLRRLFDALVLPTVSYGREI